MCVDLRPVDRLLKKGGGDAISGKFQGRVRKFRKPRPTEMGVNSISGKKTVLF